MNDFVMDKPHLPKNSKANLVPLCKTCHHNVHHDKLRIDGFKKTSKGIALMFTELEPNKKKKILKNKR